MKGITMSKRTIKWILGVIGLIFLGALGSGLWQIGIEPVFSWLLGIIFKITTLGLTSLSDAFYQDVAKGLHEDISMEIMIWYLLTAFCVTLFVHEVYHYRRLQPPKLFLVISFILFFFSLSQLSKHSYRKKLVTEFRGNFTIAKVMMDQIEEEMMLRNFTEIKNKQDYQNILDALDKKQQELEDLTTSNINDKTK